MRIETMFPVAMVMALAACAKTDQGAATQQGAPATDAAAVRTAIESNNAAFIAAMEKGDSVTVASFYDPNGMVMPHGMNASAGPGEIRKMFGGLLSSMKIQNMKLQVSDVVASGDLAIETGHYEWTMVPPQGKAVTETGKYVVAWRKQADGSWKLFRDIFNQDAPPPPSKPAGK